MPLVKTGFEGKPLRVVIQNWLYTRIEDFESFCIVEDAEKELRKRFSQAFPRPDWMGKERKDA